MFFSKKPKTIYLDYASATPVSEEACKAMEPYFTKHFGNPSAIHSLGVFASVAVGDARALIAKTLRVRKENVFFTGSGTESNNIALQGVIREAHRNGRAYEDMEIIATSIEHASIGQTLTHLRSLGVVVKELPVDEEGIVVFEDFLELLSERTILVTCAYINSEIGVIQPILKLARAIRAYEERVKTRISFHVDGAQAPLWISCALDALGADILSLDTGKCYGPKGVGILAVRTAVKFGAISFGGSQESGIRPGTENVPLIVGASIAIAKAQECCEKKARSVEKLRDAFITQLLTIEGTVLNGSHTNRVANNVNISIKGIDSEYAVITLNEHGIYAATKSACGGAKGDGSSVVRTLSGDQERAISTIRFTLGYQTTQAELDQTVRVLRAHVTRTRSAQNSLTV